MSEVIQLPLIPGTLAVGACYATEQARYNAYFMAGYAALNGSTFFNTGTSEPAPEFRTYLWVNGNDMRIYEYVGRWRTPSNYTFEERRMYRGTEVDLETWDGGETGAPMWEVDHDYDGRSPMGPGAIPTSNPAKTLSEGEAFGEGAHAQTSVELFPHSHEPEGDFSGFLGKVKPGQPSNFEITGGTEVRSMGTTALEGGNADGDAEPANVVHPVLGTFMVKWTGKLYRYAP